MKDVWVIIIMKKQNETISEKKKDAQMKEKCDIQMWCLNITEKMGDEKKGKKSRLLAFMSCGNFFLIITIHLYQSNRCLIFFIYLSQGDWCLISTISFVKMACISSF